MPKRSRGTTTERGYGADHQRERDRWVRIQREGGEHERAEGALRCRAVQCLMPTRWIWPGEAWDLGHDERRQWRGPEHEKCNRSEGGIRGNAVRGQPRPVVYRGHLSVDARGL
ncbi:hypothetical protein [Actinophytocola sp.]|uniref:hypothetical protein n=1 Tax=Actinophytocola sp. TaxID=1872138 RepID=UPI002D6348BC|nr:hypothetical protein [Actinophytocola sp.]HYQ67764.1 hypothetical protein [Actinophytocola sp.]